MFAQDRLSLFIGRANKYAAVELSDYRKRLCVEYNISNQLLDDYYRRCGSNWGNVGLALAIWCVTITSVTTGMAGIVYW